jgi:hypothetical protein
MFTLEPRCRGREQRELLPAFVASVFDDATQREDMNRLRGMHNQQFLPHSFPTGFLLVCELIFCGEKTSSRDSTKAFNLLLLLCCLAASEKDFFSVAPPCTLAF